MTDPAALEARKRELLAEVERIDAQLKADPLLVEMVEAGCAALIQHKCTTDPVLGGYMARLVIEAALSLAPRAEACSPAPKWVQDAIPDWAFERVAQLVGYGNKHGPRGSRAGVAFARYLADNEPAPRAAMGEREIEELAKWACDNTPAGTWGDACKTAIRETLRRVPGWPGEDELRDLLAAAYHAGATDVHRAWEQGLQGAADDLGEGASDYAANIVARMGAGGGA